jgi:hypothetical protein
MGRVGGDVFVTQTQNPQSRSERICYPLSSKITSRDWVPAGKSTKFSITVTQPRLAIFSSRRIIKLFCIRLGILLTLQARQIAGEKFCKPTARTPLAHFSTVSADADGTNGITTVRTSKRLRAYFAMTVTDTCVRQRAYKIGALSFCGRDCAIPSV